MIFPNSWGDQRIDIFFVLVIQIGLRTQANIYEINILQLYGLCGNILLTRAVFRVWWSCKLRRFEERLQPDYYDIYEDI